MRDIFLCAKISFQENFPGFFFFFSENFSGIFFFFFSGIFFFFSWKSSFLLKTNLRKKEILFSSPCRTRTLDLCVAVPLLYHWAISHNFKCIILHHNAKPCGNLKMFLKPRAEDTEANIMAQRTGYGLGAWRCISWIQVKYPTPISHVVVWGTWLGCPGNSTIYHSNPYQIPISKWSCFGLGR